MQEFSYVAVTKDGRKESSTIQAPSAAAAGHMLKESGLLVTELRAHEQKSIVDSLRAITTISLEEKIVFIQNLSIMLKAGISAPRALKIQVKQTRNARFKNILADVASQVESGKGLGEALTKYPNIFSNIFVSMIKVGELSGNLDKSLEYLGVQLQRESDLRSKTKGALIYPSVIVGAMVLIGILMSIYVLPNLTSIFKEFDTDLPAMTRAVIAVADFMQANGLLVIGAMIALVIGLVSGYRTYQGQKIFDYFLLYMIVINPIVKKINLARFSRVLSSLLKSGIPIPEGLQVSSDSIDNIPYRELVSTASSEVKLGKSLSDTLSGHETLFPVLVVQMLQVGEESGTVESILEQLAVHYEEEVDTMLRNLSSIIEPLLLLFIGIVVGILAVALISPIYNISQSIQ